MAAKIPKPRGWDAGRCRFIAETYLDWFLEYVDGEARRKDTDAGGQKLEDLRDLAERFRKSQRSAPPLFENSFFSCNQARLNSAWKDDQDDHRHQKPSCPPLMFRPTLAMASAGPSTQPAPNSTLSGGPLGGGRPRNDPSVCTTWLEKEGSFYLMDVTRERVDFPGLKSLVIDLHSRFQADIVIIEDKGSGTSLIQDLKSEGSPYPIAFKPEGDRIMRMHAEIAGSSG